MTSRQARDHGGNLDAAVARFGGKRADWIDLSTGINPMPYPLPDIPAMAWTALPDAQAARALEEAARSLWRVPDAAGLLAVPGASAAIARIPGLAPIGRVGIPAPTYNEHAAAFAASGWDVVTELDNVTASVIVNPNNPDGRVWTPAVLSSDLCIIDESFCDVMPEASLMANAATSGTLILKSFGKFWGLAGVRLGFVIGDPSFVSRLAEMIGPWPVAGPALHIGTQALQDASWAEATRTRLAGDTARLDGLMNQAGAEVIGGTTLFRLYDVENAEAWQEKLARHHIWSRIFPYNPRWIRLGLPGASGWSLLEKALR